MVQQTDEIKNKNNKKNNFKNIKNSLKILIHHKINTTSLHQSWDDFCFDDSIQKWRIKVTYLIPREGMVGANLLFMTSNKIGFQKNAVLIKILKSNEKRTKRVKINRPTYILWRIRVIGRPVRVVWLAYQRWVAIKLKKVLSSRFQVRFWHIYHFEKSFHHQNQKHKKL